jgi:molybdopterin-containing oxidoreductase family molybdopterin binding subunit
MSREGFPKGMDRRDFLKIAGAAALVIPSASALTACTPKNAVEDVRPNPLNEGYAIPGQIEYDKAVRNVCGCNCSGTCGINAFVKDDVIVKVEPADFPDNSYRRVCLKGISNAMQRVYSPDRIKYPMKCVGERGSGEWERISWDQAYDLIYEKMTFNIENYGSTSNAWLNMTGNCALVNKLVAAMQSNTYDGTLFTNYGLMGDNAMNMGFLPPTGTQQDSNGWHDLVGSKLIMMFSCNYAETNMQDMHFLFDAQEAGAKVVIVDPRFSRTVSKADMWVQNRPGTDAALILGISKWIVDNDRVDEDFLRAYTNSCFLVDTATGKMARKGEDYLVWDSQNNAPHIVKALTFEQKPHYPSVTPADDKIPVDCEVPASTALTGEYTVDGVNCKTAYTLLLEHLEAYTPEKASEICEVPADIIIKMAELYTAPENQPAALRITQGTNRYHNGHLPARALFTLGSLTGDIGKEHANVSWCGGVLMRITFALPFEGMHPYPNHEGTPQPGSKWIDIIARQEPYPIKMLWVNSYGWGTQGPERNRIIQEALPQLNFVVVNDLIMTPATEWADLVLPVTSYYEEPFDVLFAWSNCYVQVREQAITPMYEAKTDYQICQGLAERFGIKEKTNWNIDLKDFYQKFVFEENVAEEFASMDFEKLVDEHVQRANFPESEIAFESLRFDTPSGKLELYTEQLLEFGEQLSVHYEPSESNRNPKVATYPLTFMNSHTLYSTHSQHVDLPWILEIAPEPWIEINPVDAEARGFGDGDVVEIFNDRGSYKVKAMVTPEIKQGCLNQRQGWWPKHFPENTHYSSVINTAHNAAQDAISETNYAPYDNLVDIRKA